MITESPQPLITSPVFYCVFFTFVLLVGIAIGYLSKRDMDSLRDGNNNLNKKSEDTKKKTED